MVNCIWRSWCDAWIQTVFYDFLHNSKMTYYFWFWLLISHLPPKNCWNMHIKGQWPAVRKTWKILYLMELESNNIFAKWCPDTALGCCLTTLSLRKESQQVLKFHHKANTTMQYQKVTLQLFLSPLWYCSVEVLAFLSHWCSTAAERAVFSPSYSTSLQS